MKTHLFNAPIEAWPNLILEAVVSLYNKVFPDRVRAVFQLGSRTEGAEATVSDMDLVIVFKQDFQSEAEMRLADDILAQCQQISPIRLDAEVISEANLRYFDPGDVRISRGGALVYGEDNRADWWPPPTVEEYRDFMWRWSVKFVRAMHRSPTLTLPLAAPIPDDQFLGYTIVHRPAWYPGGETQGTKELVATVCWVATTFLANAGVIVHSRAECLQQLRANSGDDWAHLVLTVYDRCKTQWDYKVPTCEGEQAELSALCVRAKGFFEHFVEECPVELRGVSQ